MSAVLFIDANQYLDLYGLGDGKKLLELLERQKTYIFVSAQIVDEVLRNKIQVACNSFSAKLKAIKEIDASVPDHLLGLSAEETKKFRKTLEEAKDVRKKLTDHAAEALYKISRSDDDVSKRLEELFENSFKPTDDEIQCARKRKETGNPPGKPGDPLGDQTTWEQLLRYCKKQKSNRVWIITKDKDYFTRFEGKQFLNSYLHRELVTACGAALEVCCFDNLMRGVNDFDKEAGAKVAESLLSEQESKTIEKELDALPPVGWLPGYDAVLESYLFRHRQAAAIATAAGISSAGTPLPLLMASDFRSPPQGNDTTAPPK